MPPRVIQYEIHNGIPNRGWNPGPGLIGGRSGEAAFPQSRCPKGCQPPTNLTPAPRDWTNAEIGSIARGCPAFFAAPVHSPSAMRGCM